MSLLVKRGSFAANTAAGAQAVTGVGFQPKAVIFLHAQVTAADGAANAFMAGGFGVGTQTPEAWTQAVASDDAVATMNAGSRHTVTTCIALLTNGTPTVDAEASFVSCNADGFTINWGAAPDAAYVIEYLAIGGTDLTLVDAGTFFTGTTTGNVAVTGVGGTPGLVAVHSVPAAMPASSANTAFNLGFGVSASQRGCVGANDLDGGGTPNSTLSTADDRLLQVVINNLVAYAMDLVSMDADGFTVNMTKLTAISRPVAYLALGGTFQAAVLADAQKTSAGSQAKTGAGFTPKAVFAMSAGVAAQAAEAVDVTQHHRLSLGIADGAGQESSITLTARDGTTAASRTRRSHSQTKLLRFRNGPDDTILAEADLASFDADGYTLDWPTADAVAREFHAVLLGDAAGGPIVKSLAPATPVAAAQALSGGTTTQRALTPAAVLATAQALSHGTPIARSLTPAEAAAEARALNRAAIFKSLAPAAAVAAAQALSSQVGGTTFKALVPTQVVAAARALAASNPFRKGLTPAQATAAAQVLSKSNPFRKALAPAAVAASARPLALTHPLARSLVPAAVAQVAQALVRKPSGTGQRPAYIIDSAPASIER